MKFRKKPVVIDATQWFPGVAIEGVVEHTPEAAAHCKALAHVETLEGRMWVSEGDWIITGVQGERYPCKPDIFAATYEPAEGLTPHQMHATLCTNGEIAIGLTRYPSAVCIEMNRGGEMVYSENLTNLIKAMARLRGPTFAGALAEAKFHIEDLTKLEYGSAEWKMAYGGIAWILELVGVHLFNEEMLRGEYELACKS